MGANELAFAVRDNGGGAMWLYVENVTQPVCNWRPAPPPPQAVPAMNAWSLAAPRFLKAGAFFYALNRGFGAAALGPGPARFASFSGANSRPRKRLHRTV